MNWLRDSELWRGDIATLIFAVMGFFALLIGCVMIFLLVGLPALRGTSRSSVIATAPTQPPINSDLCYLTPNNRTITVYTRPAPQYPTNQTLTVNKPYVVRVIAGDWYGINWPDIPASAANYERFRYVTTDLTNVIFHGNCNGVERTTTSAILRILEPGRPIPYQGGDPISFTTGDTDLDGVPDNIDNCPNTPGQMAYSGCPTRASLSVDSDGDGITNQFDACPTTFGVIQLEGCPGEDPRTMVGDRDGDGIDNEADLCPDDFGARLLDGCPGEDPRTMVGDRDGDGIDNEADLCPDAYGPSFLDGCPGEDPDTMFRDTDNDGIEDETDSCPFEPGLLSNNGCP